MKCEDALGMGVRGNDVRAVPVLLCHLLQAVQVLQTPLKIGQAMAQNLPTLWHLQEVEEGDTGKKLGIDSRLECFVVEGNHASQRPVDILFDLVAMPWTLLQHGKD